MACVLLSWCVFIRMWRTAWLTLKATIDCSKHSSTHSKRWSWEFRYFWIMRDFAHSLITEQPILVRGLLCRDANNTKTVLFKMFFAFMPYGQKADQCNMMMRIGVASLQDSLVPWKRNFLWIMRYFLFLSSISWFQAENMLFGACIAFLMMMMMMSCR